MRNWIEKNAVNLMVFAAFLIVSYLVMREGMSVRVRVSPGSATTPGAPEE